MKTITRVILASTLAVANESCKMRNHSLDTSASQSVPGTGEDPLMDRIFARYSTDVKGIDVADLQPEQLGDCEFRSYAPGDRAVKPVKVTATSSKGLGEMTTVLRTEWSADKEFEDFNVAISEGSLSGGISLSSKIWSDNDVVGTFYQGLNKNGISAANFKDRGSHNFMPKPTESKFACIGKVTNKNGVSQITIEIGRRITTRYARANQPETRFEAADVPDGFLITKGNMGVLTVQDWDAALEFSMGKMIRSKCKDFSTGPQTVTGLVACSAK